MSPDTLEMALARRVVAPPARSDEVLVRARRHFIDTVGVTLAGGRERCAQAVLACAPDAAGGARSLVAARRLPVRDAAACNAVAGHAHDFDDDEPHVIVGHPSVAVVAALMALADARPLTLDAVLQAYIVGTETMLRIGSLVNPQHYNAGWHCTASLGVLGAAAACAHALSMAPDTTANALSIAATFAGGLKENFGTDAKPLQVGAAAGNALWACELARQGLRGAASALGGRQGFVAMNQGRDAADALADFGRPWGLEHPGFNVKMYPCCSSTHTALDAALELLGGTDWTADDIEAIDVWMGTDIPAILVHDIPQRGLEGKFSMRYCIAYATVHRAVGFPAFMDEAVHEPRVVAMMERTRVHIDPDLPRAPTGVTHQSRVRLAARHGTRVEASHAVPLGSVERPCTPEQLQGKFIACASHGLGAMAAQRVWASFEPWPGAAPAARLLDAIHGGAPP